MASKFPEDDWNFYRRVINKNWSQLLRDLDPISTLDVFIETEYITSIQARDISELPTTSDKIRKILDIATKKGPKGYEDFKTCLRRSDQEYLVDILENTEKELTKKRRDEAARKEAERAKKMGRPKQINPQMGNTKKPTPKGDILYNRSPAVPKEMTNIVAYPVQRQVPTQKSSKDNSDMRRATSADLMNIASDAIGQNWELMAPFLHVTDETVKRIQKDNPGDTTMQLYKMLKVWSQQSGSRATLQNLQHILKEVPDSVYINRPAFDDIMRQSSSEERPTERTPAAENRPGGGDISQRISDLSVSGVPGQMGNTRRQGEDFSNVYQPDLSRGSFTLSSEVQAGNHNSSDTPSSQQRQASGSSHSQGTDRKTGNDETDAKRIDLPGSGIRNLQGDGVNLPAAANFGSGGRDPSDGSGESIAIIRHQLDKLELKTTRTRTGNQAGTVPPRAPDLNPDNTDNTDSPQVPAPTCFSNPNEVKGRLKTLTEKEIKEFQSFCLEKIGEGGFGEVYKGRHKIPGLDIPVVLKKIQLSSEDEEDKMRSITNEKLASRTMHFAIVPLLAFGSSHLRSERLFYFVTPYLEKGTLSKAIQDDNELPSPLLTLERRMKILYHVASAIHFLHTPVDKFRGTILHMDIKSLNIVLDQWYNARLIDFGLAREMAEGSDHILTTKLQIPHSPGYFKTISYGQLDIFADYYNFGVVTLELLTGMMPFDTTRVPKELAGITNRILKKKIMELWKNSEKKLFQVAEDLVQLSEKCLEKDSTKRDEELGSKMILDTIKEHMVDKLQKLWYTGREWKKCDMCMQFDAVDDTILEHDKECNMKVCVSCMRHSYCNPIICHSCGEEITPNIGHGWDAVLIAGNDVTNAGLAEVFSKDVDEVKKVITSKCPLVMGISENNVSTIKPKSPGNGEDMKKSLTDQLNKCLHLEEKQNTILMSKTLLLFFSGHYVKGNGFKLGKEDEYITIRELQNLLLGSDKSAERSLRLIIFLDCCCAPGVLDVNFIDKQAEIIIVQMNACRVNDNSYADSEGSVFQRLFTQALTGNALSSKCTRITRSSKECKNCCIDNDFVTLYNLHEYMDKHFKLCARAELSKPEVHLHHATIEDIRIGYVVNFQVDFKFIFDLKDEPTEPTDIPHSMFSNIEDLRTVLFDEYLKKKLKDSEVKGPGLSTTYFRDMLFIFTKNGPRDHQHIELDTIEKVNVAWDARRDLYVSLRKVGTELIGCFFKTSVEPVVNYLFSQGTKTNGDENTMEVTTNYEEFLDYLDDQPSLKEVTEVIDKLHEFKDKFEKKQKVKCTNLRVNFPYDEKASPRFRNDFLSFLLVVDQKD